MASRLEQQPLTPRYGIHPHDFSVSRIEWEAAVFDSADYYAAIDYRTWPREYNRFQTFKSAFEYSKARSNICIYAVTENGRSVLLDRPKWEDWFQRENNRGRRWLNRYPTT